MENPRKISLNALTQSETKNKQGQGIHKTVQYLTNCPKNSAILDKASISQRYTGPIIHKKRYTGHIYSNTNTIYLSNSS